MHFTATTARASRLAMAGAAVTALSVLATTTSWAADWVLAVPGTGNPYATPSPGFADREALNLVWPIDPQACASQTSCSPVAIHYPASFWPVVLFGIQQLISDPWNKSVKTGVDDLGGYDKSAEENAKYPGNGLAQEYQADPTGHFDIVGYSQGATVAAYFKNNYANEQAQAIADGNPLPAISQLTFVLGADPQRPNGGLFVRPGFFGAFNIPILNATVGIPAKTNTGIKTTDIAIQYDGVSDFPEYPINVLADVNALFGLFLIHPTYVDPHEASGTGANTHPYGYTVTDFQNDVQTAQNNCTAANNCQQHGDTTYITLPTTDLPILAPLRDLGDKIGLSGLVNPALDLIQPMLQVLIETGYNRSNYSTFTPFQILIPLNPSAVFSLPGALVKAAVQGIQDAIGDLNGTRKPDPHPLDPSNSQWSGGTNPIAATTPVTAAAVNAAAVKTNTVKTTAVSTAAVKTTSGAGTGAGSTTPSTTPVKTPAAPKTPPQNPVVKAISGAINGAGNAIRSAINHLHGK